jgi:protoporphyrinogen oxidase
LLLRLAPELRDSDYGRNIASLRTIGAVCVVLATREQLLTDGTYWLNLPATSANKRESRFPFLALVEHTNWMDRAHYNGDRILYLGDYVPTDHEYFTMTETELIERFTAVLPTINPAFKADWVRRAWVFRAPYAQPVPHIHHSERVPTIETPLEHVFWASMNHVYPWDRGTNYAIELGRRAAGLIMESGA